MRNIESKFRCADHEGIARRAVDAGASDEGYLHQRDQFYAVPRGRLKLRTAGDGRSELIAYDRDDVAEARVSDYSRHRSDDAVTLDEVLGRALPRAGVLDKTRHLLIHGNTRIHLDDVVGLGRFVELETVVRDQSETEATHEHHNVIRLLGLQQEARIAVAYVQLVKLSRDANGAERP